MTAAPLDWPEPENRFNEHWTDGDIRYDKAPKDFIYQKTEQPVDQHKGGNPIVALLAIGFVVYLAYIALAWIWSHIWWFVGIGAAIFIIVIMIASIKTPSISKISA